MTLIEADDAATIAARRTIIVILALLALRLLMSATMPLIADEAYAVVASRTPTLSYFDHPPLAFDLARLSAWLFGSESGFVVRLPYVLLGSATAWLIFLITRRAFGAEAGFWASAAYGVAPFFFVSAGHFVVPDGPLNFFMMLTLWLMLPALLSEDRPSLIHWIAAGITLGLALLSKYSAVLFAFSALALLVTLPHGRRALKTPGPWLALVIAALCTLPIVVWNAENGWVSLGFQGHRATSGGFYPFNMFCDTAPFDNNMGDAADIGAVHAGRDGFCASGLCHPLSCQLCVTLLEQQPRQGSCRGRAYLLPLEGRLGHTARVSGQLRQG